MERAAMKIDMIIWSCDRPMQCDLLLRSMYKFAPIFNAVYVLWKATKEEYVRGYERLVERHFLSVDFWPERPGFKQAIVDILSDSEADYVLGNSDDNVFVDFVDPGVLDMVSCACAFSLRLHPGVNRCQPAGIAIQEPELVLLPSGSYIWDWSTCDPRGCWGYPHPCDSNIYRHNYLSDLVADGEFNNPAGMEIHMNNRRSDMFLCMQCFDVAKLVSICANTLNQNGIGNPARGASVEELNGRWLNGEQIRLDPFVGLNPPQCHIEMDYEYENQAVR